MFSRSVLSQLSVLVSTHVSGMPVDGSNSRRNKCSYAYLFLRRELAACYFDDRYLFAVLISN